MIKISTPFIALPPLDPTEFLRKWLQEPGPLIDEHQATLRLSHYWQTKPLENPLGGTCYGLRRGDRNRSSVPACINFPGNGPPKISSAIAAQ